MTTALIVTIAVLVIILILLTNDFRVMSANFEMLAAKHDMLCDFVHTLAHSMNKAGIKIEKHQTETQEANESE